MQTVRQTELPRNNTKTNNRSWRKKKDKKKINISDIDGPIVSSFVHVSGVTTDASGGMKMVDNSHMIDDPAIRIILTKAGIPAESLGASEEERKESEKKIKEWAEENNLYDKYREKERRRTIRIEKKRNVGSAPPAGSASSRPPPPPSGNPGISHGPLRH